MGKDENSTNVPVNVPVNAPIYFQICMKKRRYSNPRIYIPRKNGRPSVAPGHRWYVSFYWRTDPNGPLDKKFTYTKGINSYKTAKERRAAAKSLAKALEESLSRGWNPVTKQSKETISHAPRKYMTVQSALEYAYKILGTTKSEPTLNGYKFHMDRFLDWAKKNGYLGMDVQKFSIDDFYLFFDFLRFDYVNKKTGKGLSGTSVNNHKRSLSSLFSTLKNERIIKDNFIKDIPKVDQEPVNNKAFTLEEVMAIKKVLAKEDPYLIHIIRFIMYTLLRTREICRLKVKDVDVKNHILGVKTKTDARSYRRLIDKIKPTIKALNLDNEPGSYHVFSNLNKPKDWSNTSLKSRVDHFGERFRKIKTDMGFGREYSLYSFRHTAILDLYNSMVEMQMGEQEILFKLMPITQHKSVAGIKNYLRNHKKSITADHSNLYTIDF